MLTRHKALHKVIHQINLEGRHRISISLNSLARPPRIVGGFV